MHLLVPNVVLYYVARFSKIMYQVACEDCRSLMASLGLISLELFTPIKSHQV